MCYLRQFFLTLRQERIFLLLSAVLGLIILGGLGFAFQELGEGSFRERFGRGIWWAVVTITTVGYGDVVPQTIGGRLVGVGLMIAGLISLSLVTATIASIFIERKIRRERGLEAVGDHDHIIVLGWNRGGEQVLRNLFFRLGQRTPIVLVNSLLPDQFEEIKGSFHDYNLHFVRGDCSREEILVKTNLSKARRVIILADRTDEGLLREQIDQKTLLVALTVKALNPKIRITAELIFPENRPHLERAHVEDIIIRGEYDSALIACTTEAEGLYRILQRLLSPEGSNFWAVKIPPRFHGQQFKDLAKFLREEHQALLIGLYSEGYKIRLEELLSPEPTAIDEFIYRKFAEAGKTHLFGRQKIEFQINPPDDHLISPHEVAVVIATKQPSALLN
ncbi:potassium channel family protein [Desulfobacca acetoxidans]|uniref:potassium channel family protein n=1 Tax=Desulfobacca acetoxidans TaxID=60893 RepID=UPI0002FCF9EF|nr:potassium channel family protein [Desulfobacca acetoxidans]